MFQIIVTTTTIITFTDIWNSTATTISKLSFLNTTKQKQKKKLVGEGHPQMPNLQFLIENIGISAGVFLLSADKASIHSVMIAFNSYTNYQFIYFQLVQ